MPHMRLDGLRVLYGGSRCPVDELSEPQFEHNQLPEPVPVIGASLLVFCPEASDLAVVEDAAVAQAPVAKERLGHRGERAAEPLADRRLEPALAAFENRARHLAFERLAQQVFRVAI